MKRKTRTITVKEKKYIWWYRLGENTIVLFSPLEDKTSTVMIEFPCDSQYQNELGEEFLEYITMQKNDQKYCIKTIAPKMAGLLLSCLKPEFFQSRKTIHYNGFHLLSEMGYSIEEVKKGLYW